VRARWGWKELEIRLSPVYAPMATPSPWLPRH
jgi:hypothetical protein